MEYQYTYSTPLGTLQIITDEEAVTKIFFGEKDRKATVEKTPLIEKVIQQLEEYFQGKRTEFELPLNPQGTPFQKRVWEALRTIPYGETRTYKQVAEMVGNPKACRAVGMANNRNPLPIVIPCHRVIGGNGKLVGYAGGLSVKEFLLSLEKVK